MLLEIWGEGEYDEKFKKKEHMKFSCQNKYMWICNVWNGAKEILQKVR